MDGEKTTSLLLYNTETSIDLSDDERLMQLMVKAGFKRVMTFLRDYKPFEGKAFHFHFSYLGAFFKSIVFLWVPSGKRGLITGISFCGLYSGVHSFSLWRLPFPFSEDF